MSYSITLKMEDVHWDIENFNVWKQNYNRMGATLSLNCKSVSHPLLTITQTTSSAMSAT